MASKASLYQVLYMDRLGTPPVIEGGRPRLFDNPEEAAVMAKHWSKLLGTKLCVKPLLDNSWKDREQLRFARGEYRFLPWALERQSWWNAAFPIWKDHFPHASLEKPGWIAYTKSEEDGQKDKQTLLRPGAYLNRYFEKTLIDYGVNERRLVESFMKMYGPIEVKFAETEADIVQVYEMGPPTCMNGKHWHNGIHPASIYAAGDLQVAYLGDLEKKVSARTLVWPAKKIYSRVYGDIARLTQGLDRLGYKWGAPIGARLKRIQVRDTAYKNGQLPAGCFVSPYIDKRNQQGGGHLSVIDKGDHLIIGMDGERGSHHAGGADGVSGTYVPREDEHPHYVCDLCGEETRKIHTVITVLDGDGEQESAQWCAQCIRHHGWICYWSNEYFSEAVTSVKVGGGLWAKYYADMYACTCEGNGKLYHEREIRHVHLGDGTAKILSLEYINAKVGKLFESSLSSRLYPVSERVYVFGSHGYRYSAAKEELPRRTFQCSKCEQYTLLEYRKHRGDDKLYCDTCYEQL